MKTLKDFKLGDFLRIRKNGNTDLFQKAYEMGILPEVEFEIIQKDAFDSVFEITDGVSCFAIRKEELWDLTH